MLVVTHELDLAAEFADRIVLLHKGKCLRVGTPAEVYEPALLREVFEAPLEVEMRASGRPRVILRGIRRGVSFLQSVRHPHKPRMGHPELQGRKTSRILFSASRGRHLASANGGFAIEAAVHNHRRLRAREDGENPSPPRDCKAEQFRRAPLARAANRSRSIRCRDGKAAPQPRSILSGRSAEPGDRRSLNPDVTCSPHVNRDNLQLPRERERRTP